ncbi:MAG: hypothetical protein L0Z53_15640 [Acidobacteriales bacterium]|nr:hypothetical protein [Terriglobales bacterium]
MKPASATDRLRGSAVSLFLYDVCEEIKLDALRAILGARRGERLKHAAAEQIDFERPPVIEQIDAPAFPGAEKLQVQVKFYDYGVISVIFEFPFSGDWDDLIALSSRWIYEEELERQARQIAQQQVERARPALIKPYSEYLNEEYFIFFLREVAGSPSATHLLASCGQHIAQVVRGESAPLSESERAEVLQSAMSYYPNDLIVVGWNAAFVYDSIAGAETAMQLLEYANTQLLEFRHYDDLLTRELEQVYDSLGGRARLIHRWRLPREASRLLTLLLEVGELTERADNAIKFLSDMFSARLYRLASSKVGVSDYKNLVKEKLKTAEELYRFLIDQFHQTRNFVLEAAIVIILIIELARSLRGTM